MTTNERALPRGFKKIEPSPLVREEIVRGLGQFVVGQDEALDAVASAILRSRSGLRGINRPVGSFMFLGQTGVGKSETAKAAAQVLFGEKWNDHLKRVDCTTLQESQDVKRILGAQPEYVGYGDPLLIPPEFLNQPGGSVIIFDEIEKAHSRVWRLLLSILGEGELQVYAPTEDKDPKNHAKSAAPTILNFRNSYIFFTSNIGVETANKLRSPGIGFVKNTTGKQDMKLAMLNELRKVFAGIPELLGRIGESNFIVFNPLSPGNYARIFDMVMDGVNRNQQGRKISISVTPELKAWLINKAVGNGEFGARDIIDVVDKYVLSRASEVKGSEALGDRGHLLLHLEEDSIVAYAGEVEGLAGGLPASSGKEAGNEDPLHMGTSTDSGNVDRERAIAQQNKIIETDRNVEFEVHPSFRLKANSPETVPVEKIDLIVHHTGTGFIEISEAKPKDPNTIFVSDKG